MPSNYNITKPKSIYWINLAIRATKFFIFVSSLYFSYFFLNTTQIGETIVHEVNHGFEHGRIFVNDSIQIYTEKTPVDNNIYERERKVETLAKLAPEEIGALGIVKLPYGFQIQDEYKGIKLVRSPKKTYSEIQIKLIEYFIDQTPPKLLDPGPDAVVIFEPEEIEYDDYNILSPSTLAFSSGTYMFLTDTSFEGTLTSLKTVDESLQTFFHELMHVAHFNFELQYLTQDDLYDMSLKGEDWTDLIKRSELTKSFQELTEWKYSEEKKMYYLETLEGVKTSTYGKSAIYEDMAETVAGVATSQMYIYSDNRIKWALAFTEQDYDSLTKNKFPHNELLVPVRQENPRLNYVKEDEYKKRFEITDRQYFLVQEKFMLKSVTDYFVEYFPKRGFTGSFEYTTDKNNVEKYHGEFSNGTRTMYIELESFDNAKGYSVKPKGTIINIINGYNFSST